MAQQVNLQAATRANTGKGAARSLRREGKVPGVIYGHNRSPETLAIEAAALNKMLIGVSAGTTVFDVVVHGRPAVKALIREIQRDSVRPAEILHLDLYEVRADEKVTLSVPIHLTGVPDGVRNFGGVLDHVLRELEIEVLPADIPEHVELDVTALTIGHSLFVRDVRIEKAEILNDPDTPVCTVVPPAPRKLPRRWRKPRLRQSPSSFGSPSPTPRRRPNRKPEPCTRSWGSAIRARSTSTRVTTQGSFSPIGSRRAGSWGRSAGVTEHARRGAPGKVFRSGS